MKKALILALALFLATVFAVMPVFAANADPEELGQYGQIVHNTNYVSVAPKLDGVISEGEYGPVVYTMTQDSTDTCQYWAGEVTDVVALSKYLPTKVVLYVAYDQDAFYVSAVVTDENHCSKYPREGGWNGDALEVDLSLDFDGTTTGMMNRYRITFSISEDGIPYGFIHNAPTGYGVLTALTVLNEGYDFAVSRNEDTDTTIYETAFYWSDLSGSDEVPAKIFTNVQLHLAHPEHNNGDYFGAWRYAVRLPAGTDDTVGWALHIYNIDSSVFAQSTQAPATTEAPKTDAPATEAPATEAPTTDAPATDAPATNAPSSQAPAEEPAGTNFGLIIGIAAAVIVVAVVAVIIIKKKNK